MASTSAENAPAGEGTGAALAPATGGSWAEAAVPLAQALVRLESVNPGKAREAQGEAPLARLCADWLRHEGGATSVELHEPLPGRPCVLAWFDFGASRTLAFDAHLDTVSVGGMTIDPFGAELREGRLWGRGSADVKGPMAAMMTALAQARRDAGAGAENNKPAYNCWLALVCDEEVGFGGVQWAAPRLAAIPAGSRTRPEFVIVAEPTLLDPVVGHKGTVRWKLLAEGVACHASVPERGANAIYRLAEAVLAVQAAHAELAARPAHPTLGHGSFSVGTIHGGLAVNIVPDSAEAGIDRRLLPGETVAAATAHLISRITPSGCTLSPPLMSAPAFEMDEASAAVQAVLRAARLRAGAGRAPRRENYCTNASFYAAAGLDAVVWGPGDIAQAHTRDEWIELEQLIIGAQAYHALLHGAGAA